MRVMGLAGLAAAVAMAGGSGWWIYTLQERQQATTRQLQETAATLRMKEGVLSTLEAEHRRLSESFEELKERWTKAAAELQHATQTSQRLQGELSTLTNDRTALQQQIEEADRQQRDLRTQLDGVRRQITTKDADRAGLSRRLDEALSRSLTQAELEQLSRTHAASQAELERLNTLLEEGADAYEALVARAEYLETQVSLAPSTDAAQGPADADSLRRMERAQQVAADQLATLYHQLGDAYLAMYSYAKAAEALERSLAYRDEPAVHGKLAFIYTRLLPQPEKASHHAASTSALASQSGAALGGTASAKGLPRDSKKLFWQWLVGGNSN